MWDRLRRLLGSDEGEEGSSVEGDIQAVDLGIEEAWKEALQLWGEHVTLSPPQSYEQFRAQGQWRGDDPLAFIDLKTRQVVVNYQLLSAMGAENSLEAVLAHEIGHHVAFPRSLGELAKLEVMERQLMPELGSSLVNLFLDLQINEFVGRTQAEELSAVYRGFRNHHNTSPNPIFSFYLAIYEELWGLEEADLVGKGASKWMGETYPSWRADALIFAQTFYDLPDTYLQFVYFCSVFPRYIRNPNIDKMVAIPAIPLGGDMPTAEPGDYAGAIRGAHQGRSAQAIEEAIERGWLNEELVDEEADAFDLIDGLAHAGHGRGIVEFRREIAEKHYAHLVERHLIELPESESTHQESIIPQTLEPWESGDDPQDIDWIASTIEAGPLAAVMPRKRIYVPDDEGNTRSGPTSLEIYLDTSGSMPAPDRGFNAMTLAAQVLSAAAIRSEGRVRAAIYSDGTPMTSSWMYDEAGARRFLMHYSGGGTYFPFDLLEKWATEEGDVIRVVISDHGFIYDLGRDEGPKTLAQAAERSRRMVVVLAGVSSGLSTANRSIRNLLSGPDVDLVTVEDLADLGQAAQRLSDALFERV